MYWQLFASFFKIGAFTFGGGWAMISIIEREIVDRHHWIERDEFLDLLAIAQSLPGILAVNIATAVGEDAGTIEEVYEPFLIKEGFLKRTPRGREATELAYKHLGFTPPGGTEAALF